MSPGVCHHIPNVILEYLPYDYWDMNGNRESSMYFNTWHTSNSADRAKADLPITLNDWTYLLLSFTDGTNVKYEMYSDYQTLGGVIQSTISGGSQSIYPTNNMRLSFANWFADNNDDCSSMPTITGDQTSFLVDYVLYVKDQEVNILEMKDIVEFIRQARKDNLDYIPNPELTKVIPEELNQDFDYLRINGNITLGECNELKNKLEEALQAKADGKHIAASNKLNALENKIQAMLNSAKIDSNQYHALKSKIEEIRNNWNIYKANHNNSQDISVNYRIYDNYPNPFNPSTKIEYYLAKDGYVSLKVYNILSREVQNLVQNYQKKGSHTIIFSAEDLASGVYYYRIETNNFSKTEKMILLR